MLQPSYRLADAPVGVWLPAGVYLPDDDEVLICGGNASENNDPRPSGTQLTDKVMHW